MLASQVTWQGLCTLRVDEPERHIVGSVTFPRPRPLHPSRRPENNAIPSELNKGGQSFFSLDFAFPLILLAFVGCFRTEGVFFLPLAFFATGTGD